MFWVMWINGHTSVSSPETWSRYFSSVGPDAVWSAGWSHSLHRCCRHLHHVEAHHTVWAQTPPSLCVARYHAADPKHAWTYVKNTTDTLLNRTKILQFICQHTVCPTDNAKSIVLIIWWTFDSYRDLKKKL